MILRNGAGHCPIKNVPPSNNNRISFSGDLFNCCLNVLAIF